MIFRHEDHLTEDPKIHGNHQIKHFVRWSSVDSEFSTKLKPHFGGENNENLKDINASLRKSPPQAKARPKWSSLSRWIFVGVDGRRKKKGCCERAPGSTSRPGKRPGEKISSRRQMKKKVDETVKMYRVAVFAEESVLVLQGIQLIVHKNTTWISLFPLCSWKNMCAAGGLCQQTIRANT